jgi:hypothetical protein
MEVGVDRGAHLLLPGTVKSYEVEFLQLERASDTTDCSTLHL